MKYTIQPGDTLGHIAKRFYGDAARYSEIAAANGIENADRIRVGEAIELPGIDETEATGSAPVTGGTQGTIGVAQLTAVMPEAREENIERYLPALQRELPLAAIDTPLRIAHFIAQIAHESGSLRYVEEDLNYSASALRSVFGKYFPDEASAERYARQPEAIANIVYAGRMGNGDSASGDGWRYRGRGLIQLTGRDNYRGCGKRYGVDYQAQPERIADQADDAVRAACWFWEHNGINRLADEDDVRAVTRRINGGENGLADRKAFLTRAKAAFHAV